LVAVFPVLLAGALNAKHVEWNSRIITRRGRLLRDYADRNSCLIYGPSTPTTLAYNPTAAPDVVDIVIAKNLVLPLHLTTCSALSSDHLPVLKDRQCRSSFPVPPDRLNPRKTDWPKLQTCLEVGLPSSPDLTNEVAIDACFKELYSAISKALTDYTLKCRPRADPRPQISAYIHDKIRLKKLLRRRWQTTGDPALKVEVNRLQRSVTTQLNEWRNDQ
jgi:hypothetical protein